jgi:hypothetical protein
MAQHLLEEGRAGGEDKSVRLHGLPAARLVQASERHVEEVGFRPQVAERSRRVDFMIIPTKAYR